MCNSLRNGNRVYPIPEWGFGYKVFENREGDLVSHVFSTEMERGEWIVWDIEKYNSLREGVKGFCFLGSRGAIRNYMKHFIVDGDDVIHKIRYRGGLGKRREGDSDGTHFMSSLCKEFKILKEVDIKELK